MAVTTRGYDTGYEFEDEDGNTLDLDAGPEAFTVYMSGPSYRDRDNYDTCDDVEIKLGVEEVRELVLLGTVWLEKHDNDRRASDDEDPASQR